MSTIVMTTQQVGLTLGRTCSVPSLAQRGINSSAGPAHPRRRRSEVCSPPSAVAAPAVRMHRRSEGALPCRSTQLAQGRAANDSHTPLLHNCQTPSQWGARRVAPYGGWRQEPVPPLQRGPLQCQQPVQSQQQFSARGRLEHYAVDSVHYGSAAQNAQLGGGSYSHTHAAELDRSRRNVPLPHSSQIGCNYSYMPNLTLQVTALCNEKLESEWFYSQTAQGSFAPAEEACGVGPLTAKETRAVMCGEVHWGNVMRYGTRKVPTLTSTIASSTIMRRRQASATPEDGLSELLSDTIVEGLGEGILDMIGLGPSLARLACCSHSSHDTIFRTLEPLGSKLRAQKVRRRSRALAEQAAQEAQAQKNLDSPKKMLMETRHTSSLEAVDEPPSPWTKLAQLSTEEAEEMAVRWELTAAAGMAVLQMALEPFP
eukprot:gnl/TRDRNA2_/TRDRNA2_76020_c0_seq1.p1 gnl/TRDRNA2_/TRDRNA2_76020_c0~~gnl/TRDRNA2_/TRDRNA2_76020_c0_seq1.p1  ORF type:complete len:450 (-),score=56.21 gnl/TRDRNA2_/TRDRNA2_76020_c0_seq1:76-1356(-)